MGRMARSLYSTLQQSSVVMATGQHVAGRIVRRLSSRPQPSKVGQPKGWRCISGCGACCYLEPSSRSTIKDWLDVKEYEKFLSMVGPDGWCVNYDKQSKECGIYERRPGFCRVGTEVWREKTGARTDADVARLMRSSCREWITLMYGVGKQSPLRRFDKAMGELSHTKAKADD